MMRLNAVTQTKKMDSARLLVVEHVRTHLRGSILELIRGCKFCVYVQCICAKNLALGNFFFQNQEQVLP